MKTSNIYLALYTLIISDLLKLRGAISLAGRKILNRKFVDKYLWGGWSTCWALWKFFSCSANPRTVRLNEIADRFIIELRRSIGFDRPALLEIK